MLGLWWLAMAWAQDPVEVPQGLEAAFEAAAEAQEGAVPAPEPSTCPEAPPWPVEGWPTADPPVAADAVAALDALMFPEDLDWSDPKREGVRTHGVLVVHRGEVVHERYAEGWGPDDRHLLWSVTKSFANALVGIAVGEGRLSVDDSICEHLGGLPEASCAVTVDHLLQFGSGFDWVEVYESGGPVNSSVLAMLYGEGRGDMARFVASHPLRSKPEGSYGYSSGDTNVLTGVLGAVLAPVHGERFPFSLLLDPLGMDSAVWERDQVGTYIGSSNLYATPRDMARFGAILLANGCIGDTRILPDRWIARSTRVNEAIQVDDRDRWGVQGRQFWINQPPTWRDAEATRPWPSAPADAYAALGHWGQAIYVVPSKDLVVVRTGDDRVRAWTHDELLGAALALVEDR